MQFQISRNDPVPKLLRQKRHRLVLSPYTSHCICVITGDQFRNEPGRKDPGPKRLGRETTRYWPKALSRLLPNRQIFRYSQNIDDCGSVRGSPIGTIGYFTKKSNGTIGTNGITNGTIGKTLNDIDIPLVPLGNTERML